MRKNASLEVFKGIWMWHLRTGFSDEPGDAELMIGHDLGGLLRPKRFYDSKSSDTKGSHSLTEINVSRKNIG